MDTDSRVALFGAAVLSLAIGAKLAASVAEPVVWVQFPTMPAPMAVPQSLAERCGWHPFIVTRRVTTATDG